ncbi:MAG: methyltransferase domain-containing protein, partial [Planctomycetota bacterium]|nr:methyltransferase domain-containing protein [Planctomycetota bacterium]
IDVKPSGFFKAAGWRYDSFMKNRPQASKAVIAYHNRVAPKYDQIYSTKGWEFYRAVTWEIIRPHLPKDANANVIDLGCGTGEWGLRLAKSGYRTVLLDISPKMLEVARRKAEELGVTERVEFVQSDICRMEKVGDEEFDFAVAEGDPICHASDPPAALKEIRRILKPGAILCASIDNACAGYEHFIEKGDLAGLEKFVRSGKTEWLAQRREERFEIRMFTPDQFSKLLKRTGFEVLSVRGKTALPLRKNPDLLSDKRSFQKLLKLEMELNILMRKQVLLQLPYM